MGRRADDEWRPTADDAAMEDYDEELEEELEDEVTKHEKRTSASPKAHGSSSKSNGNGKASNVGSGGRTNKTSASHRPKRQQAEEDEAWKPTDEDIEDEELEVQEMVNDQLLREELEEDRPKKHAASPKKSSTPKRKKPATGGRKKKQQQDDEDEDDDMEEAWDPEGAEIPEEEEYDEEYAEESEDERPSGGRKQSTPKRKTQKRPAEVSAGSPEQHKVSKPGPRPKHRLTQATNKAPPEFLVQGQNSKAPFTFAAYRGEGMSMLAMNWKNGTPPEDFVGFVIEYQEPQESKWWPIPNYMSFPGQAPPTGEDADSHSSRNAPIQRFRWIHFPYDVNVPGKFHYRVTPVFMKGGADGDHSLTYGEEQEVAIELMAETYPGKMNVAFTRGFISSKAFSKKYGPNGGVGTILPAKADEGLDFKPKDPEQEEKALSWMGFEARQVILSALDAAIKDTTAEVRMLAYDFNDPEIVLRLQKVGKRVKIIIDDSDSHGTENDAETKAAAMLAKTAGKENVQRQHSKSFLLVTT